MDTLAELISQLRVHNPQEMVVLKNTIEISSQPEHHALVNLVTAFVPSETACFASSPGKMRRTAV
jgi:hypothetical protein